MTPAAAVLAATTEAGDAASRARARQRVRADLVKLFLTDWKGSLLALTAGTLIVVLVGRWHVPDLRWLEWGGLAFVAGAAQAAACRAMEGSAAFEAATRRWMPWLLTSIGLGGIVWGALPWMLADGPTTALLFASLVDVMLLCRIANAPGTPAMTAAAAMPIALLGTGALWQHDELFAAGLGFLALMAVIAFYGLKFKSALSEVFRERHAAADLAVEGRAHRQRLLVLERERTLLLERQRLTHDLHARLGSALGAMLAAVQHGEARPERLAAMLRDCVDDLRAVVDALEPIDHDLAALLANLRCRMERRLSFAGIRLEWHLGELPPLPWIGPSEALHIVRIVQEVLANSIRHSDARCARVEAAASVRTVEVLLADDGVGFDPEASTRGRGLRLLEQGARALGSRIQIESRPGEGACVRLVLPIDKAGGSVQGESAHGSGPSASLVQRPAGGV